METAKASGSLEPTAMVGLSVFLRTYGSDLKMPGKLGPLTPVEAAGLLGDGLARDHSLHTVSIWADSVTAPKR